MHSSVEAAYHHIEEVRPLVRPTYDQFEVALFPPYGDPEVHLLGEGMTYVVAGLFVTAVTELLHRE
jgi:hypothetical protein